MLHARGDYDDDDDISFIVKSEILLSKFSSDL